MNAIQEIIKKPVETTQEQANVLALIQQADNGIKNEKLISLLHKPNSYKRTLYQIIRELRLKGYPIGNDRVRGYYIIKSKADKERAIYTHLSLAEGNREIAEALEKVEV